MSNLPPLPLTDGCLLIDNSMLEGLVTCPSITEFSKLHARIAASSKPSLDFGTIIHKALEYRYTNAKDKPMTAVQEAEQGNLITAFFDENPVDEFEHRNANFALEVIKRYNRRWQTESFNMLLDATGKVICEIPLSVELFNTTYAGRPLKVIFTGRIDLPVEWDGKITIIDNKTSSMFFGPQRFLDEQRWSNQYRGYCWGFEKTTGRTVEAFCVNGICSKQPPMKPKQGIDQWWNEWMVRDITHLALTPDWRTEWFNSTTTLVDQFLWYHEKGFFPPLGKFTRACENYGGCQYRDVCSQPEGKRVEVLNGFLYKKNEWSPLQ